MRYATEFHSYRGWCGHHHRIKDQAEVCTRRLNASWAGTGERWELHHNDPEDVPVTVAGQQGKEDAPNRS